MKRRKGYQAHNVIPEKEFAEVFEDKVEDEPVTAAAEHFEKPVRVSPQRVITLTEGDYAQLQSLVLKYGSGTGHGTSTNITLRVAVADAEYKWS